MSNSLENALIAFVLFVLIFIPIYISVRNGRKKKHKKIANEFSLLEKKHNLSFQVTGQLDSFSIMIDQIKKVIVIVNLNDYQSELIDLKQVSDCVLDERKQGMTIRLLQLVLLDKKGQPMHQIAFYRQYADNEGNLKRIAVMAEQWLELMKAAIANREPFRILEKVKE